jgi:hypothetical protein
MKYAVISLGGALGMGLSAIADAMNGYSEGDLYAGIGCAVMILGLIAGMGKEVLEWWENRRKDQ